MSLHIAESKSAKAFHKALNPLTDAIQYAVPCNEAT